MSRREDLHLRDTNYGHVVDEMNMSGHKTPLEGMSHTHSQAPARSELSYNDFALFTFAVSC